MFIGVFGTPSPLTHWTLHALRIVGQVLPLGPIKQIAYFDEFLAGLSEMNGTHGPGIFWSECPENAICRQIVSSDVPIIFTADEPEDVVSFLMSSRGMSIEEALRHMSRSLSTLSELRGAPNVLDVRKAWYSGTVRDCLARIIEFCGLMANDEQFEQIVLQLVSDYQPEADARLGQHVIQKIEGARWPGQYPALDAKTRDLATRVGAQYSVILRHEYLDRVVWPREIFFDADNPGQFVGGPKPMIGPARCLIFGPYMHLPRGAWDARVEIEVDDNESGNEILSDVVCDCSKVLAGIKAILPRRGIFAYEISFAVRDPLQPLEVRILLAWGAIEGTILLRTAEIRRTNAEPSLSSQICEIEALPSL